MARWKFPLIAVCVIGIAASAWFKCRSSLLPIADRQVQPNDVSRNVPVDAQAPVFIGTVGPAEENASATMGFGQVVKELDKNRIENAPLIAVPFESKSAWVKLVEDTLVQRNGVLKGLRRQLEESIAAPDRSHSGRFHSVVIAIGEFRDREALPQLIPLFDFELDQSTFPPFSCFPMHFPVAEAIAKIGGLDAADLLAKRANEPMSGRQVCLSAWILCQTLSKKGAQEYLRSSLNGAKSPLQVRNLRALMEFVDSKYGSLSIAGLTGEHIDGLMQKHFPALVESK